MAMTFLRMLSMIHTHQTYLAPNIYLSQISILMTDCGCTCFANDYATNLSIGEASITINMPKDVVKLNSCQR